MEQQHWITLVSRLGRRGAGLYRASPATGGGSTALTASGQSCTRVAGRTAGQRPGTQSFRSPGTAPAHHHSDPTEMTKPVILGNCQLQILNTISSKKLMDGYIFQT